MTLDLKERPFKPGSTGWSVDDLDDPTIERLWEANRYEIVEGVLAEMPPAAFEGGLSLYRLIKIVDRHLEKKRIANDWGPEIDFIVAKARIAKPDAVLILEADKRRQLIANARLGKNRRKSKYGRLRVAPTMIIESISPGHERHDRVLKRHWYAEFGVKNYWMLHAYRQTLECLVLDGDVYKLDVMGRKSEKIRPSAFPGLVISLGKLWV